MPFFSARCSTCTHSCSAARRSAISPGAVGRAVVDDQDAKARAVGRLGGAERPADGAREHLAGGDDDGLDVLGLVVGRQDQPRLAGHRPRTLDASTRRARRVGARGDRAGVLTCPRWRRSSPTPRSPTRSRARRPLRARRRDRPPRRSPTAPPPRPCATPPARSPRSRCEGRATELAGIGATLQEKIVALVETGSIPAAEKLRAKFPPGLVAITRLPGLGPKRARLLYSELGIDSPAALREAALAQRLRTVRGLGPKFEESVLAALDAGAAEQPAGARCCSPRALELGERSSPGSRASRRRGHAACSWPARRGGGPTASRTST